MEENLLSKIVDLKMTQAELELERPPGFQQQLQQITDEILANETLLSELYLAETAVAEDTTVAEDTVAAEDTAVQSLVDKCHAKLDACQTRVDKMRRQHADMALMVNHLNHLIKEQTNVINKINGIVSSNQT